MDNYVKNVGSNKMEEVKNVDNLLITQHAGGRRVDDIRGGKYEDKKAVKCDVAGKKGLDMGIMYIILILDRSGVVPGLKKKDGADGRGIEKEGNIGGGNAVRPGVQAGGRQGSLGACGSGLQRPDDGDGGGDQIGRKGRAEVPAGRAGQP